VENKPTYSVNPAQKTQNTATIKPNTATPNVKLGNGINAWPKIIADLKQEGKIMLYTNLINTAAKEINDMTLGVEFPNGLTAFGKTVLEKPENMDELVKQVSIEAGKEMRIKLIDLKAQSSAQTQNSRNSLADLGININVIDN